MALSLDDMPPRAALCEIARDFHARGWMSGTAGNLSARADAESFWITASGKPKGRLDSDDFLLMDLDGRVLEQTRAGDKPSAESGIHAAIYRLFPAAGACLHGHSVDAALVASGMQAERLPLPPLEMLKGFDIWEQAPKVELPVFENYLDVGKIAAAIEERFRRQPPPLSALLVKQHGITVWGKGLMQAYNRFECLELVLSYVARARSR